MANLSVLQRLVDSNHNLVLIETDTAERIVEMFHRFNIETGCAVYDWDENNGLHRIGFEHILIPRTKTSKEILSYILTSRHFGIYLVDDPAKFLSSGNATEILTNICTKTDGVRRLVVFVGDGAGIPETIRQMCVTIRHSREQKRKPAKDSNTSDNAQIESAKNTQIQENTTAEIRKPKKGLQRFFGRNGNAAVATG